MDFKTGWGPEREEGNGASAAMAIARWLASERCNRQPLSIHTIQRNAEIRRPHGALGIGG
jgi:hypothetical protein